MYISQRSFEAVTRMFREVSGISLNDTKRQLVISRLQRLASERGMDDLDAYVAGLERERDPDELVRVVDRLTTNETFFFREIQHFDFLSAHLERSPPRGEFRVWSAASSSGEEAYSVAMLLADQCTRAPWSVVGTDLSTQMVDAARRGLYPMSRAEGVPPDYLKRFCLKGMPPYEGQLLIDRALRQRVRFQAANLMQPLPDLGLFDVIFLRNVLIYFDPPVKREIVLRVLPKLKPGGLLFSGHAESLGNLNLPLKTVQTAIYARQ